MKTTAVKQELPMPLFPITAWGPDGRSVHRVIGPLSPKGIVDEADGDMNKETLVHRIQLRRTKGWKMPDNTVSVARPGPFGNPFRVGVDGSRQQCVTKYARLMRGFVTFPARIGAASIDSQVEVRKYLIKNRSKLKGKNLACWCPKDGKPCHADVINLVVNHKWNGND